jgi:hypothetical protein
METDPLFATFYFANINGVQFGFFRQLFLTHAGLNPALADSSTENLELSSAWHRQSKKQEAMKSNTPNMGLFFTCASGLTGFHLCSSDEFSESDYAGKKVSLQAMWQIHVGERCV